ncbi:M56 family metallopeptidase [Enterococcus sp. HY326]|uniref:M56 family metallopeptidase n=1 Tax=Enterococcus sp. HY326 TaxID=2971265 RepID=UPI00223FCC67|nr:M56 family metallopeptidase [Enterococcus sp. HY326]
MRFSLSSFLISLLFVVILVLMLQFILWKKKSIKVIRSDFIFGLFLIIFLRLILPIELPTTITLKSEHVMPAIFTFFQTEFSIAGQSFSVLTLTLVLWGIGTAVGLLKMYRSHRQLRRTVGRFKQTLPLEELPFLDAKDFQFLKKKQIPLIQSEVIFSAMAVGIFKPKIILSKKVPLDSPELKYILKHEIQHLRNHDILFKYLLDVLTAIYWWFPFIYLLRRQLNLIIELRVDNQVTKALPQTEYFAYVESLVAVVKTLAPAADKKAADKAVYFSQGSRNVLYKRVTFLLEGYEIKRTNYALLAILGVIILATTSIIFEPYNDNSAALDGTLSLDDLSDLDAYLLHTKDGKYYLFYNGENLGEISDTNQDFFTNLPIHEDN